MRRNVLLLALVLVILANSPATAADRFYYLYMEAPMGAPVTQQEVEQHNAMYPTSPWRLHPLAEDIYTPWMDYRGGRSYGGWIPKGRVMVEELRGNVWTAILVQGCRNSIPPTPIETVVSGPGWVTTVTPPAPPTYSAPPVVATSPPTPGYAERVYGQVGRPQLTITSHSIGGVSLQKLPQSNITVHGSSATGGSVGNVSATGGTVGDVSATGGAGGAGGAGGQGGSATATGGNATSSSSSSSSSSASAAAAAGP